MAYLDFLCYLNYPLKASKYQSMYGYPQLIIGFELTRKKYICQYWVVNSTHEPILTKTAVVPVSISFHDRVLKDNSQKLRDMAEMALVQKWTKPAPSLVLRA